MNASSESGLWAIVIRIEPGIVLHRVLLLPVVGRLLRQRRPQPDSGAENVGGGGAEFARRDLIEQFLMGWGCIRRSAVNSVEVLEQIDRRGLADNRHVVRKPQTVGGRMRL